MNNNNNLDTPAEWIFVIFIGSVFLVFLIAMTVTSWRTFQDEEKEREKIKAREFRIHVEEMEHEMFTGPFASHRPECPGCYREMKEGLGG